MARISRWFLEIFLDGGETLRWWSGTGALSFEGEPWTGLGQRWIVPEEIERSDSMKGETIDLEFDSSRQSDNTDAIGILLDRRWRRRQCRLRRIAWDVGDGPEDGDILEDERGRIRNLSDTLRMGQPARITLEMESGALAYLERRMATRSPAGQKAVFPEDRGFDLMARLEGVTLPWLVGFKKTKPKSIELQDDYRPVARQLALGRFVTSGSFVAAFTNQNNRAWWQTVYTIADHRITSLDRIWINGELVRSTPLVHGQRTLLRIANDKGEDRCWVTFYDGRTDQAADSYLQSVEPSWTADHRLRGVAYFIAEHRWDSDLPESFDWRVSGTGAALYDRRKDSTRGGSGTHRWDDPATWEYSTNAMVAADHYRIGRRIMSGSSAMWFGVGEPVDAVPYAEFAALADHCDDWVALKNGGSQRRYEVNGILSASESHDKNLQRIADQMAAKAIDQGGRISIRPPITRASVITLTDGDLVRGTESRVDPGGGIDKMVNTIEGRFINPDNDYKSDDYPRVQVEDYIEEDGSEIEDSLNLDLELSGERAQRIAKLKIEASRCIFEQEETYLSKARVIRPGDWFVRQSVIRGFSGGKTFIATRVKRFANGTVRVKAKEVYPDQLVWDENIAADLSEAPDLPDPELDPLPVPVVTAAPVAIMAGDATLPAVRLTHAGYASFIGDEIIVEMGFSNGQDGDDLGINGASQFAKIPGNIETVDAFVGLPPSTAFAIRFRARRAERHSAWSPFQEFYSTSIYRVGDVSTVGGRSAEDVIAGIDTNAEAVAREILMRGAWHAAVEPMLWIGGQTVGAVAQEAREVNDDSALSLSLLGVRNETDTAFILSADSVTIPSSGEPGSSAISLTAMRSQHDQNMADIVWLLETVDGSLAQASLTLDVNGYITGFTIINDGTPETSGFYVITSNFAIVDPGNGVTVPFYPFAVSGGTVYMSNVVVDSLAANSVTVENLQDNSTAEILVADSPSTQTVPSDATWLTAISAAYTAVRSRIMVDWEVLISRNGGDRCRIEVRIYRGAELEYEYFNSSFFPNYASAPVTVAGKCIIEGIPAGSHTYSMQVRIFDNNGGITGFTKTGARFIFTELKQAAS